LQIFTNDIIKLITFILSKMTLLKKHKIFLLLLSIFSILDCLLIFISFKASPKIQIRTTLYNIIPIRPLIDYEIYLDNIKFSLNLDTLNDILTQ